MAVHGVLFGETMQHHSGQLVRARLTGSGSIAARALLALCGAVAVLCAPYSARAQVALAGQLIDSELYSPILQRYMPYRIYVPPNYALSEPLRYPTLYMLHGAGGDYTEWSDSYLPQQVDSLIVRGDLQPMIVVMPEGGGRTYFANWDNGPRYSDYLAQDVVGEIDVRYRTVPLASARAIGGLSMGGLAALQIGMRNPYVFGVVGAHSPSVRVEPDPEFWFLTGQNYREHDPIWLAGHWGGLERMAFWLDVGDDDWWKPNIDELRRALLSANVNLVYRQYPGTHEAEYWIAHVPDYLRFYGDALRA